MNLARAGVFTMAFFAVLFAFLQPVQAQTLTPPAPKSKIALTEFTILWDSTAYLRNVMNADPKDSSPVNLCNEFGVADGMIGSAITVLELLYDGTIPVSVGKAIGYLYTNYPIPNQTHQKIISACEKLGSANLTPSEAQATLMTLIDQTKEYYKQVRDVAEQSAKRRGHALNFGVVPKV